MAGMSYSHASQLRPKFTEQPLAQLAHQYETSPKQLALAPDTKKSYIDIFNYFFSMCQRIIDGKR